MKIPYKFNKKKEIWQLVSICDLCKREKCDFETKHLTGCTEFAPPEESDSVEKILNRLSDELDEMGCVGDYIKEELLPKIRSEVYHD